MKETERVRESGSPLDRLSAGASPGVVSPKFHPLSTRCSYNPRATPTCLSLALQNSYTLGRRFASVPRGSSSLSEREPSSEHRLQKQRESSLANLPCVFYRHYLHTHTQRARRGRITVLGWKKWTAGTAVVAAKTQGSACAARYRIIYVCT